MSAPQPRGRGRGRPTPSGSTSGTATPTSGPAPTATSALLNAPITSMAGQPSRVGTTRMKFMPNMVVRKLALQQSEAGKGVEASGSGERFILHRVLDVTFKLVIS
ncbi:hypothetical protein BT69DRAFT_1336680 [Atractiella rhizophila]|nr:hypothetical protein BT69DRAFT_1336680 [Atractiella rhizophila]